MAFTGEREQQCEVRRVPWLDGLMTIQSPTSKFATRDRKAKGPLQSHPLMQPDNWGVVPSALVLEGVCRSITE